jgi:hypothetical protein
MPPEIYEASNGHTDVAPDQWKDKRGIQFSLKRAKDVNINTNMLPFHLRGEQSLHQRSSRSVEARGGEEEEARHSILHFKRAQDAELAEEKRDPRIQFSFQA